MSSARLILTFVTLFAFGLQSYLTQTHIHHPPVIGQLALAGDIPMTGEPAKSPGDTDKYPANQDPANCPLCQEIALAGYFVAPAAVLLVLPTAAAVATFDFAEITLPSRAPSHNWQGRAPPIA